MKYISWTYSKHKPHYDTVLYGQHTFHRSSLHSMRNRLAALTVSIISNSLHVSA